MMHKTW